MTAAVPGGASLYARQPTLHAREVSGRFDRLRKAAVLLLLGLYYVLPWVPWDGRQAVLFDLPARRFHVFGLSFWPQDFFYLAWLLIMAALLLFFVTAVAGRLWCGYACPQTVWTEAFVWMERLAEGPAHRRMRLDRGPWSAEKIFRRSLKHLMWAAFALLTGLTFVGYFTPVQELVARLGTLALGPWETFWIGFYGLATWGNAGFLREQVCKYMCPYARFQGSMFDQDTLIVSYDAARGEPRGSRRRGTRPEGLGDCTDCTLCVQACPTGIDIRKGLQYECIACAACVDACDSVMDRIGYPHGLIRYTTANALAGRRTRIARPRTIVYGVLLLALFGAFAWSMTHRAPLQLDVIRDRTALWRELPDGRITNLYLLKVLNKSDRDLPATVAVEGLPGAALSLDPATPVLAAAGLTTLVVTVGVPAETAVAGSSTATFVVRAGDGDALLARREARFLAPLAGGNRP